MLKWCQPNFHKSPTLFTEYQSKSTLNTKVNSLRVHSSKRVYSGVNSPYTILSTLDMLYVLYVLLVSSWVTCVINAYTLDALSTLYRVRVYTG